MVRFESAKVIDEEEIREMIEENYSNPTVERLMFIEAKERDDRKPSKIFPCYLENWGQMNPEDPKSAFYGMTIVQSMEGEFGMVRVRILASDLGVNKRIWDKPPTKSLRDETPWVEKGVQ